MNQSLKQESKEYIRLLLKTLENTIAQAEAILSYESAIEYIYHTMLSAQKNHKTIFFIGNGGSAGIAVHFAADYQNAGRMKTQTFYDPALITCMANDYGYEQVFAKPLELHGEEGDVLIAISSSGNSPNIINGAAVAREKGMNIITMTGFKEENQLKQLGDLNVYVPICEYGIVESIHNLMLQQVIDLITKE
ncbi:MAG: SIS domain-containing protein [Eubacteriales bacterium]